MAKCKLTERIIIEKFIGEVQTPNGFDEIKWDNYYKCWSAYKDISGKEFIAAKATNSENIVTFTVRYCNKIKALLIPGANKNFRIKYKGFYYNIEYTSDYNNSHEFVDIKATIIA